MTPTRRRPHRPSALELPWPLPSSLASLVLLVSLAAATPLLAQRQAPASGPQTLPGFSEVLDVRVVNLEVVVTDGKGQRVTGLGPDDFELTVDRQPTPIEFFTEVRDGAPRDAPGVPSVGSVEAGTPVVTNFLLFIDDFFSVNQDRDRVLDRLVDQMKDATPGDRFAVVAFDGRDLDLLSGWTADRDAVIDVLRTARTRPTFGLQRLAEMRTNDSQAADFADIRLLTIERMQSVGGALPEEPFARIDLDPEQKSYAFRLTSQLERSVIAATSASRSLSAVSGRKVMLLLVGGWPFDPAEFTVGTFSPVAQQASAGQLQTFFSLDLFAPLVDSANLTGFTLYPVDVPGNDTRIGLDAADDGSNFERLSLGSGFGTGQTPREQQLHASLDFLAERTGGKALRNAQRDEAFALAAQDTRTYYWLGFSPTRVADDSRHRVRITVRGRPDLDVRTRDSFVDLSTRTEISMIVESSLLFGDPPSVKPLRLEFGKPRKRLGKVRFDLEVGIDMDYITLIPNQGRYQNQLEIRIAALNSAGERSETTLDTITIDGAAPPKPGQFFFYETQLTLRGDQHRIVVAVFDPISGDLLSSSGEISTKSKSQR